MADRRRPDAVLVVHGIGEQVSNDTARSLAVALADPARDRVRSAADLSADGSKQRVYSIVWDIESTSRSPVTRVSEGYWAYRFRDTTWSHVTGWLVPLLRRPRDEAPDRFTIRPTAVSRALVALALAAGLVAVLASWAAAPLGSWLVDNGLTAGLALAVASLLLGLLVLSPRLRLDRKGLVPWGLARGIAVACVLVAVTQPLFGWLVDVELPVRPDTVAMVVLVALALVSLAVDVLTLVRVLAVITATAMLVLVGAATVQNDAGGTVLALLASAALPWLSAAGAALLLPSLGDAARYFRDHPSNEEEVRKIRRIVIDKLRELHELDDGRPRFERVVVVGHSLGSVIAYDALNHFWAETSRRRTVGGRPDCQTCAQRDEAALRLEAAAHEVVDGQGGDADDATARRALAAYRRAQWELGRTLRAAPAPQHHHHLGDTSGAAEAPWLVTDLVTLGSPLASISFLAEAGGSPHGSDAGGDGSALPADDVRRPATWSFEAKIAAREYPSCPPMPQTAASIDPIPLFSDYPLRYPQGARDLVDRRRYLHHAAVFGPTRWTNAYFENDLVGGPVASQLGPGVLDIELPIARPTPLNFLSLFSHTSYWNDPPTDRLDAAARSSRRILTDLVAQQVGPVSPDDIDVQDLEGRKDVVRSAWSSSARSAARQGLADLDAARRRAFAGGRLERTRSGTAAALRRSGLIDRRDLLRDVEEIHADHGERCIIVVAAGELIAYRLVDGDLHRDGYRTVELHTDHTRRRCRTITVPDMWPGSSERKDAAAIRSWLVEFLTADVATPTSAGD